MTDPYQVLGVSPTASDDEVKKAYRTLCKRYHPDANVGKPDAAQAEKKFMEVQQAYEEIMHRRQGGGQRAGSGYITAARSSSDSRSMTIRLPSGALTAEIPTATRATAAMARRQQDDSIEMRAAKNYIDTGHYAEALNALGSVPPKRNARWHFSALSRGGLRQQRAGHGICQTGREHGAGQYASAVSASFRAAEAGMIAGAEYGRRGVPAA